MVILSGCRRATRPFRSGQQIPSILASQSRRRLMPASERPTGVSSPVMPRASPPPTNIPTVWIFVLFMGFALALDPFRLGFAMVLTSRRRPMLNLFAFWLGGMAAGIGLALCGLLLLRDFTQVAVRNAMSVFDQVRSSVSIFAGGRLQITLGVIALLAVLILRARERARRVQRGG